MAKYTTIVLLFIINITLFYCSEKKAVITKTTSDISGNYIGVIPCADCDGIKYDLTLADDSTFFEELLYIGKSNEIVSSTGSWEFINDSTIQLNFEKETKYFRAKDGLLMLLDKKGRKIKSEFEGMYTLRLDTHEMEDMIPTSMGMRGMRMMAMPMEEIKADFKAQGMNPDWGMEWSYEEGLILHTPSGDEKVEELSQQNIEDTSIDQFIGNISGQSITVTINQEDCFDSIMNTSLKNKVEVKISDENGHEINVFSGCGQFIPDTRLHDIWVLTHINGEEIDKNHFNENGAPVCEFYVKEERVSGFAGCNNFNGNFTMIGKNELQFGMMAMTRKMCPQMEMEERISKIISDQRIKYQIQKLTLSLENEDGTSLTFQKTD